MKKINCRIILSFSILIGAVACSSDEPKNDGGVTTEAKKEITLSRAETQIAKQNNNFGIEFLKATTAANNDDAFAISPYSVAAAYSILVNGVTGVAQAEIVDKLSGQGVQIADINSFNSKMLLELPSLDSKVTFATTNALCSNENTAFKQSFLNICDQTYKAQSFIADLRTQQGIDVINNWAVQHTNGLITRLLNGTIDADFGILNATYFKGAFQKKFDKSKTKNRDFTSENGVTHSVPTMCELQSVRCYESEKMSVMQIPFGNGSYRLNIILPGRFNNPSDMSINTLLTNISVTDWNTALNSMITLSAYVYLPKFAIEYKKDITPILKNMGIREVFNSIEYNTGILTDSSKAKIKSTPTATRFSVDEEGAEAASATIITGMDIAVAPESIYVNRPFAFIVDETSTGVILFAGTVRDI